MQIVDGWLAPVEQIPSENCDERPLGEISLIVVHCISLPAGHFGNDYVEQLFTNNIQVDDHPDFADLTDLHVASHLFIRRDGKIQQYVPFHKRAWHAGVSSFEGREQCNDFSIGIELEGTDTGEFNNIQYAQLIRTCNLLLKHYSIPSRHIVGHSDIAPGRKTDPGSGFDWQRLQAGIAER